MKLSAPIYLLKQQAKALSRKKRIPLHQALDQIAEREGFNAWSLLSARQSDSESGKVLLEQLYPGDMVVVAARPGHGKTLLSLEFLIESMKAGHKGVFFTLAYTHSDILEAFARIGENIEEFDAQFEFDNSDTICASHVISRMRKMPRGTVAVIDYLQALDHKRENPSLMDQIKQLKVLAQDRGFVFVFISQIDNSFDTTTQRYPEIDDIRLPNSLDMGLFDKSCFLKNGSVVFSATA